MRPPPLEWQVFRGSAAVAAGLLSAHQLRGRGWIRLRHDVYADSRLPVDHALLCRATLARLPPDSVVLAGPSAAVAHGVVSAALASDPVHLIVRSRVGRQTGTQLHRVPVSPDDLCLVSLAGGSSVVPATTPARTAWDAAVWLPLADAVALTDGLLFHRLVTVAALRSVTSRLADRPGGRRAGHTLGLADGRAASRAESLLRVRLYLAGLPLGVARPPIFAVAPCLAWPEFRVAFFRTASPSAAASASGGAVTVDDGWLVVRLAPQSAFSEVVRHLRAALAGRGWRNARKQDVVESALSSTMR
ncbi:hypothetical protein SAMN05421812_113250 [Asanoa hainanensis]|uniref:Transcriptional regulator, AbiEi antitoxin, Type IV TA system n=1 Tax=Asanoa hainanensis TaxID=560556 RepID=A0A239P4A3_9ACTN|nr:hypothetical protein [Asanoa hainanensis]SNT61961.1 hypothetical protein SAMN05421812_113250 [Asanoa hainanensis]